MTLIIIHKGQENPKNVEPLSLSDFDRSSSIEYRIAYIALGIQNNDLGKQLLQDLKKITKIDPEYIQFGSAEWFWRRQVNSYALQVEPERYKTEDRCRLSIQEALYVEKVRTQVFKELEKFGSNEEITEWPNTGLDVMIIAAGSLIGGALIPIMSRK